MLEQLTFKMNKNPPRRILRAELNFIEFSFSPKLTKNKNILNYYFIKNNQNFKSNVFGTTFAIFRSRNTEESIFDTLKTISLISILPVQQHVFSLPPLSPTHTVSSLRVAGSWALRYMRTISRQYRLRRTAPHQLLTLHTYLTLHPSSSIFGNAGRPDDNPAQPQL